MNKGYIHIELKVQQAEKLKSREIRDVDGGEEMYWSWWWGWGWNDWSEAVIGMLILDGWTFMIVKLLSRQKMCQKVGNSEIYNALDKWKSVNMLIKVCQCMCQSVTRHEEEGKLLYIKC